jgi:hypothetical protein
MTVDRNGLRRLHHPREPSLEPDHERLLTSAHRLRRLQPSAISVHCVLSDDYRPEKRRPATRCGILLSGWPVAFPLAHGA